MFFKKIDFYNFRNINNSSLNFNPEVNFFIGKNGQGKTNVLEALYFLTHGSSFRPGSKQDFIFKNSLDQEFSISCYLEKNKMNFSLKRFFDGKRLNFLINEKAKNSSTHGLIDDFTFPTIIFSPDSLSSIKGSPSERRDLLDETIQFSFPQGESIVQDFQKLLKSRNKLLHDLLKLQEKNKNQLLYLETLTEKFIEQSTLLIKTRLTVLSELEELFSFNIKKILGERNNISYKYMISNNIFNYKSSSEIQDFLFKRYSELKSAELSQGTSLIGPQKHDVLFFLNENDSRYRSSQGQQRSIILSFKLAQAQYHYKIHGVLPVLLLDDVLSELDEEKKIFLIQYLENFCGQIFISATNQDIPQVFKTKKGQTFYVSEGIISEE